MINSFFCVSTNGDACLGLLNSVSITVENSFHFIIGTVQAPRFGSGNSFLNLQEAHLPLLRLQLPFLWEGRAVCLQILADICTYVFPDPIYQYNSYGRTMNISQDPPSLAALILSFFCLIWVCFKATFPTLSSVKNTALSALVPREVPLTWYAAEQRTKHQFSQQPAIRQVEVFFKQQTLIEKTFKESQMAFTDSELN